MPAPGKSILIYESALDGHRAHYLKVILGGLTAQRHRPVVALPIHAATSPEFQAEFAGLATPPEWDFSILPHPSKGWRNGWTRFHSLLGTVRKWRPQIVLIPTGDGLAYFMCLAWLWWWHPAVRSTQFYIGLHRLRFGYPARGLGDRLSRLVMWLGFALAPVRRYSSVDEIPVAAAGGAGWFKLSRLRYMPDPITPAPRLGQQAARAKVGLPADAHLIGLVGMIDERKGALALVLALPEIFQRTKAQALLAGKHSERVRVAVRALQQDPATDGRLVSIDRFLTAEELLWWVESLDILCLLQPGHIGISSFLLRAAQLGVPVLGSDAGWVGRQIRHHGMGWTVDAENLNDIAQVAVAALAEVEAGRPRQTAGSLTVQNSASNFLEAFLPPGLRATESS